MCPDTPAYRALGLPRALLYEVGRSESLARALAVVWKRGPEELNAFWEALFEIAERFTLDFMHGRRAAWIQTEVLGRRPCCDNPVLPPWTR